jgi:hypothetical protein
MILKMRHGKVQRSVLWILAAFKTNSVTTPQACRLFGTSPYSIPIILEQLKSKGLLSCERNENPEFESWSVTELGFEALDKTGGRPPLPG